jgi:cellulose synthase/poly-beta-1,6-N-acetylglucosamine synthase-like glycosyltransferase
MRCPTLSDLPPPPPQKTGWPWTEESLQLPDLMPNGSEWPQISIVTPNYNYGQFIEETIRSVLLQGYPNLEYIIIDGASTDNSSEIVQRYESWLSYWISEEDKGQSDAINVAMFCKKLLLFSIQIQLSLFVLVMATFLQVKILANVLLIVSIHSITHFTTY